MGPAGARPAHGDGADDGPAHPCIDARSRSAAAPALPCAVDDPGGRSRSGRVGHRRCGAAASGAGGPWTTRAASLRTRPTALDRCMPLPCEHYGTACASTAESRLWLDRAARYSKVVTMQMPPT